jgi:hypothetical protein
VGEVTRREDRSTRSGRDRNLLVARHLVEHEVGYIAGDVLHQGASSRNLGEPGLSENRKLTSHCATERAAPCSPMR